MEINTSVAGAESWLSEILDAPVTADDCRDGFVFVQLLGVIDPSALDLTPYIISPTTPDYWQLLISTANESDHVAAKLDWPVLADLVTEALTACQNAPVPWGLVFSRIAQHFKGLLEPSGSTLTGSVHSSGPVEAPSVAGSEVEQLHRHLQIQQTWRDPNFSALVLHALLVCQHVVHHGSAVSRELGLLLDKLQKTGLEQEHSLALARGHLLTLLASHVYPGKIKTEIISSLFEEPSSSAFESVLRIPEALGGEDYYQHVLVLLLNAFHSTQASALFHDLEVHICTLPNFDEELHTPFDLDDALLIWAALLQPSQVELVNLATDLDGPVWSNLLQACYLPEDAYSLPQQRDTESGKLVLLLTLSQVFRASQAKSRTQKVRVKRSQLRALDQSSKEDGSLEKRDPVHDLDHALATTSTPRNPQEASETVVATPKNTDQTAPPPASSIHRELGPLESVRPPSVLAAEAQLQPEMVQEGGTQTPHPPTSARLSTPRPRSSRRVSNLRPSSRAHREESPLVPIDVTTQGPSPGDSIALAIPHYPPPRRQDSASDIAEHSSRRGTPRESSCIAAPASIIVPSEAPPAVSMVEPASRSGRRSWAAGPIRIGSACSQRSELGHVLEQEQVELTSEGNDFDDIFDLYAADDEVEVEKPALISPVSGAPHPQDSELSTNLPASPPVMVAVTAAAAAAAQIGLGHQSEQAADDDNNREMEVEPDFTPDNSPRIYSRILSSPPNQSFFGPDALLEDPDVVEVPLEPEPVPMRAPSTAMMASTPLPPLSLAPSPLPPSPPPPQAPSTVKSIAMVFDNDDFKAKRVLPRQNSRAEVRAAAPSPARPASPTVAQRGAASHTKDLQRQILEDRAERKGHLIRHKDKNIIQRNVKNSSAHKRSNKRLILNALQMLLAGGANVPARTEVLEDLERSGGENFVILLRGAKNHSFKGLYTHLVETGQIVKLYGSGPIEVSDQDITDHFKYDSGSRSFKSLSTRSMSTLVHGMVLNTNVLPSSATTVRAVDRR